MNLYLDIETVPCDDPEVINEIASTITPPGNYKKAETIATWEQHEKPRIVEEVVSKTSFDGGYGRVVCACYAAADTRVWGLYSDEPAILKRLFDAVATISPTRFIGHNVSWDLRMLYQRAVVNGIEPPSVLLKAMRAKPWDDCIADTMLMWHPERDRKISLEKLCKILKVKTSKSEMNGSMVAQYYKEGRIDEIADYCRGDVVAVRECYKRLSFAEVA